MAASSSLLSSRARHLPLMADEPLVKPFPWTQRYPAAVPAADDVRPESLPLVDDLALRMLTAVVGAARIKEIHDQFWAAWPEHMFQLSSMWPDLPLLAAQAHRLTELAGSCGFALLSSNCRDLMVTAESSPDADRVQSAIGDIIAIAAQTQAALDA